MAPSLPTSLLLFLLTGTCLLSLHVVSGLVTCPGFPGYCSEAFPGTTCSVVCDVGRNNVPLCQDDGTWTDIPRCIEHDPGVEEQIPGRCPDVSGYCSLSFLNQRCKFDCRGGPDIDSVCTEDGTWYPYPTCQGDYRDTRDGCDGCPGPKGGARNRTAEQILLQNQNIISDKRQPKIVENDGGRKTVPSFAGNINIGRIIPEEKVQSFPASSPPSTSRPTTRFPITSSFQRYSSSSSSSSIKRTPVKSSIRVLGQTKPQDSNLPIDTIENRVNLEQKSKPIFRKPSQAPSRFRTIPPQKKFGVFEAVSLGAGGKTNEPLIKTEQRSEDFFGVYKTVNLS